MATGERTADDATQLGPYRLRGRLGEGGMGVVHLGLDPAGRAVAVKVLRAHVAHDPEARARLAREVSTLRRVRHPLVAEVIAACTALARDRRLTLAFRHQRGHQSSWAGRDDFAHFNARADARASEAASGR